MQTLERVVSHDIAARMIAANRADQEGAKAAGAYQAAQQRTHALLKAIESQIGEHAERCDESNATYPGQAWHFVGDLNSVNTQLADVLAQLGGKVS